MPEDPISDGLPDLSELAYEPNSLKALFELANGSQIHRIVVEGEVSFPVTLSLEIDEGALNFKLTEETYSQLEQFIKPETTSHDVKNWLLQNGLIEQ